MLLELIVSLAVAAPAPAPARAVSLAATSDDPRIKVWLNHDDYRRGDKARGNVKGAEDGYLDVQDRKSTRLNSSHQINSYAVFCLKKKKKQYTRIRTTVCTQQI